MSWLFGMNQRPQDFSQFVPPPGAVGGEGGDGSGDSGDGKGVNSAMEAYRFDSAALERAAKAAKDLEKSGKFFINLFFFFPNPALCHPAGLELETVFVPNWFPQQVHMVSCKGCCANGIPRTGACGLRQRLCAFDLLQVNGNGVKDNTQMECVYGVL